MKDMIKVPTCKCMQRDSDFNCERGTLDKDIVVYGYDYFAGHRANRLQHNYCPECGMKYTEREDK